MFLGIGPICAENICSTFGLLSIFLNSGSIHIIKSMQLSASPCLTPLFMLYPSTTLPFMIILLLRSLYRVQNIGTKLCKPNSTRHFSMYPCSTESNAFFASSEIKILSMLSSSLIRLFIKISERILSLISLPLR